MNKAAKILGKNPQREETINLLARNWCQVKYSKQVIAIGHILNPGEKSAKGYRCNSKYQSVDGGTGYAVQMAIDNLKEVYVFDQIKEKPLVDNVCQKRDIKSLFEQLY